MVARRHSRGGRQALAAGGTGRVRQAVVLALIGAASVLFGAVVIGPQLPAWLGQSPPERPRPAVVPHEPSEQAARPRVEVPPVRPDEPPPGPLSGSVVPKRPAVEVTPLPATPPAEPAGQGPGGAPEDTPASTPPESGRPVYRVRVGRDLTRQQAEALRDHLLERGVAPSPVVLPLGDGYTVQVGAFRDWTNASALVERLRAEALNPRVEPSPP